jgi:hypothetical protein
LELLPTEIKIPQPLLLIILFYLITVTDSGPKQLIPT